MNPMRHAHRIGSIWIICLCLLMCGLGAGPYMIENLINSAGCIGVVVAVVWLCRVIKSRTTKL